METYFLRCINGHQYEASRYKVCPYCGAKELDNMQNSPDPEDGEEVTVRNHAYFETEGNPDIASSVDPGEERTVRYSEYYKVPSESQEEKTVNMRDAGLRSHAIDPVEVALSDSVEPDYLKELSDRQEKFEQDLNTDQKGQVILEPAGWLVCIEGADFGKSYPLREGKNSIGRSDEMDVVLKNDPYISRRNHAWIEYNEAKREFIVSPGETRKMIYLNDELLLFPGKMARNDTLTLEDSTLMLIPCCDEKFSWKSSKEKGQGKS